MCMWCESINWNKDRVGNLNGTVQGMKYTLVPSTEIKGGYTILEGKGRYVDFGTTLVMAENIIKNLIPNNK